ncbi:hypothetical protein HKX48_004698 [Thoreauomyces humboldtii]|nr:hypothetical protein HKX48_004698 [Thoreauomyces humboldtii]
MAGSQQPQRRGGPQGSTNAAHSDDASSSLRKRYQSELGSLKQLFGDWSEADLLAVLEETVGDLDLAIVRITEGHAQQWGEVKKKDKKEKAKGFVEGTSPSLDRSSARGGRGGIYAGRGGRGGSRGGRGGGRGGAMLGGIRGGRQAAGVPREPESTPAAEPTEEWGSNGAAWGASDETTTEAVEKSVAQEPKPAWGAAPASASEPSRAQQPVASTAKPETKAAAPPSKAKPAGAPASAAPAAAAAPVSAPAPAPSASKPKSWAALVKGPEPVPVPTPAPVVKPEEKEIARPKSPVKALPSPKQSPVPAPATAPVAVRAPSPLKSPVRETPERPMTPEAVVRAASPAPAVAKPISRPSSPPKPAAAAPVSQRQEERAAHVPGKDVSAGPPGLKQNKPAPPSGRKLKQDAAVVMPSNASLGSIGVQFGSLNVGGGSDDDVPEQKETAQISQPAPQSKQTIPAESTHAQSNSHHTHSQPQHQRIPAAAPASAQSAPGLQQAKPETLGVTAQPSAPGLPNGMGPYNSYFPTQQLPGASGFGLGHMGNVPAEYSALYGSDAQARAAMMHGYYDPASMYQQSVGTSKYPGQDATLAQQGSQAGQASPSALPQQQQQQQQQQGYPLPYPYYPYYHMPSQFQSYQSSPYGQPFVNKSVYPGYPQQQSQPQQQQQPSAGTNATKPGATSNSYGYGAQQHPQQQQQQHYQQQGYDDLASGIGSQDYKGAYGGLPHQSFQAYGLHQQTSGQNKAGSQQAPSSVTQDYKSQQASRPARQTYDSHKYPGSSTTGGPAATSSAVSATSASSVSGGFYNQQHLGGMPHQQHQPQHHHQGHHQQPHQQSSNPYMMHQPYQASGAGGGSIGAGAGSAAGLYSGGGRQGQGQGGAAGVGVHGQQQQTGTGAPPGVHSQQQQGTHQQGQQQQHHHQTPHQQQQQQYWNGQN